MQEGNQYEKREGPGFTVTLRDVYDLLVEHNKAIDTRISGIDTMMAAHALHDEQRFAKLTTRVTGALASLVIGLGTVIGLLAHAKGF